MNVPVQSRIVVSVVAICIVVLCITTNAQQNHLEPIPPYYHFRLLDTWQNRVLNTLVTAPRPKLWMIVLPAFSTEYAVILEDTASADDSVRGYQLTYVKAEESIGGLSDSLIRHSVMDTGQVAPTTSHAVAFPAELATRLIDAWTKVIKDSRYPKEDVMGLDGVTYYFYANYGYFGKTWSPKEGIPKEMVECGELLIKYVAGSTEGSGAIENQIRAKIMEIDDLIGE